MSSGTDHVAILAGSASDAAEEAIEALYEGRPIAIAGVSTIPADGQLCIGSRHATAGVLNWMITHGRGLTSVALTPERCSALELRRSPSAERRPGNVDYLNTIEAREGITTGISAADRARTIQVAGDPGAGPGDLVAPGHVVPIRCAPGGVLERPGCAEAALDLLGLAGLERTAALCHALDDDGGVMDLAALSAFATRHRIPLVTTEEVADLRMRREKIVTRVATSEVATPIGPLPAYEYVETSRSARHFAVVVGGPLGAEPPLVEVHPQRPLEDALGTGLSAAVGRLSDAGGGVLLYLGSSAAAPPTWRAPGVNGTGDQAPTRPLMAYAATQILRDLDVTAVRLR